MFAKGARFPPEKPSTTSGPSLYKLHEESKLELCNTRAFLEETDRFASEKSSDVPCPRAHKVGCTDGIQHSDLSNPLRSNQGLTHLQQQIETLQAQDVKLLKDHQETVQTYRDKITQNESTIESLVKDNVGLQSQIPTEQKAHRSSCQREAVLRAGSAKAEASTKSEVERASVFAGLQRKLQALEKVHSDDKKRYEAEVGRLKCELDTSRKVSTEQKGLITQLRRQQEASELRMKDFKKANITDQAEIKRLRLKVENTAQAKIQLASSQDEMEKLRKSLQSLEIKYKTEIQNQHLKLTHQEKSLTSETRRRQTLEDLVGNLKSESEQEAQKARDYIHSLQEELDRLARSYGEAQTSGAEEGQHLIDIQATLVRVTEAYGHLAASSISLDVHQQSELQCASLRLRNIRLERRLADRDALVEQLTDYCRQASEEKNILVKDLGELANDQRTQMSGHYPDDTTHHEDISLICSLFDDYRCARQQHASMTRNSLQFAETMGCFYETNFNDLLVAYAMACHENMEHTLVAERLINQCTVLQTEADALRLNNGTAEAELSQKSVQIAEAVTRETVLNERLQAHQREIEKMEDRLEKERQTGERFVQALHQSKKNEERLSLEVDELVDNLADLTRYREAHADLLTEVVALIERNELAEAEADRLGKFNAEILGHTNPNQKIFYVDRIRRELAETKHQLLKSTRDRDDLAANNAALHHEVAAYKSIAVPLEQKPRGTRVRIERPPLTTRSINKLIPSTTFEVSPPLDDPIDTAPMTIDEIM